MGYCPVLQPLGGGQSGRRAEGYHQGCQQEVVHDASLRLSVEQTPMPCLRRVIKLRSGEQPRPRSARANARTAAPAGPNEGECVRYNLACGPWAPTAVHHCGLEGSTMET